MRLFVGFLLGVAALYAAPEIKSGADRLLGRTWSYTSYAVENPLGSTGQTWNSPTCDGGCGSTNPSRSPWSVPKARPKISIRPLPPDSNYRVYKNSESLDSTCADPEDFNKMKFPSGDRCA